MVAMHSSPFRTVRLLLAATIKVAVVVTDAVETVVADPRLPAPDVRVKAQDAEQTVSVVEEVAEVVVVQTDPRLLSLVARKENQVLTSTENSVKVPLKRIAMAADVASKASLARMLILWIDRMAPAEVVVVTRKVATERATGAVTNLPPRVLRATLRVVKRESAENADLLASLLRRLKSLRFSTKKLVFLLMTSLPKSEEWTRKLTFVQTKRLRLKFKMPTLNLTSRPLS